jgi:hypothetical protein
MGGFTKFDPRAFLGSEETRPSPAKPAKPAKVFAGLDPTLATLATLAARPAGSLNPATPAGNRAPNTWGDEHEERAAIVEHDGGIPRAWADAVARLDPARAPCDMRWLQFIDDCGRFLDGGWADRAAALGWGPLDLFGCDRDRPIARIDHAGLLWLLNGRKLVALSQHTATIETATGARQTYYRRPIKEGRVALTWELVKGTGAAI